MLSGGFSYQPCMVLNCLLNALRFNTDITLCGGGAAVLQEVLHKGYIAAVGLVDLRGIPLAETVSADIRVAKVVANDGQLLLHGPLRDGEYPLIAPDAIAQTVVFNILLDYQRHGEDPALPGLLLHNLQAEAVSVPDNIA